MENKPVDVTSPCIRNCCLNTADICLGCYRSLDEIMGWSKATTAEKKAILARTESRRKTNN